jgi:protein subunit release factor A
MSRVVLRVSGRANEDETILMHKLLRMYSRYAESQGWKLSSKVTDESSGGPLKEVVVEIGGEKVHSKLKYESGVHRIQWVPPKEQQCRVFTAKLSVAVVPEGKDRIGTEGCANNEKIRTYNFPQDRLTDHRTGLTFYELDLIFDGELEPIIRALAEHDGRAPDG